MTRQEVLDKVSPTEFKQWVAYFSLENEEYKEKLEYKIALEKSAKKTEEQRAKDIENMLMELNNGVNR